MGRFILTDEQRRALRQWYQRQPPSRRQIDAIKWFEREHGHRLRQSTVSDTLSEKYSYLDGSKTLPPRQTQAHWPILESILFAWQQQLENNGGDVTGDVIIAKAKAIWPQIPDYVNLPIPEFSPGWLGNFKRRHNIKSYKRHGEAASVPAQAEEQMRAIRTLCGDFAEEDIFNMDETGLYWRQSPSVGLATRARPGRRKDKSRLSIICCCNFTGSQRFPLWVVGKAARPYTLRGVNLEALNIQWQSNSKAWMNTELMKSWLQAFYRWIGTRRVLLLMDNLKAHISGVEQMPPPSNICIQWLPPNSTSIYQPLDQGIIYQFKRGYKKLWIRFMVSCYEQGSDPVTSVNLYFALRWASQAWFDDLRSDTVYRCFRRARIQPIQEPIYLSDPQEQQQEELEQLYKLVQEAGNIQDAMSLDSFLSPDNEAEEPVESSEFDLAEAISMYSQVPTVVEESDEEAAPVRIPTNTEAEQAAEMLLLYAEHQERTTADQVKAIRQLYEAAKAQKSEQAKQITLDSWLT